MAKYMFKGLVAAGLLAGAVAQSHAAPVFTVNPTLLAPTITTPFQADFINGSASTLLTATSANTVSGTGYTVFGSFVNGPTPLFGFQTGLNNSYQLWAEFSFTTQLKSGTFLAGGSDYNITGLTFRLYGDTIGGADPTFNAAAIGSAPSVAYSGNKNDLLLGSGTLNMVGNNAAGINDALGSSLNAQINFALTDAGKQFFVAPDPFYNTVFSSFTNTTTGVVINQTAGQVAINSASGGVNFVSTNDVPEPGSMALIGAGLLGLAAIRRRQNKK